MALLPASIEDLESFIQNNSPAKISRDIFQVFHVTNGNRDAIRQWLRLNGMNERAIATASNTVLANAYRVGKPYIDKVNADERPKSFGMPARRSRSYSSLYDLAIDFDDTTKNLLSKAFDEVEGKIPPPLAPAPNPAPAAQIKIDEAAIARAAVGVIGPRIQKALAELTDSLNKEVDRRTTEVTFTNLVQDAVKSIAAEAAQTAADATIEGAKAIYEETIQTLRDAIPRRIEVITKTDRRILPAEPRHEVFDDLLETLLLREHAYLVGEAGTGKTHLFKQVCVAMGYDLETEFFPIDQSLTKYDVKGYKNPVGNYVQTAVYKAVKLGGFMCIDEGDMWAAAALGSLNSILANDYGVFGDELVKVHPKFRCALAANTFGFGATAKFIGRNPLDQASLDRFTYIPCHYDENLERVLYGDTAWTTYVHRVRAAVNQLELQHVVSMRAISRGRKFLDNGADPERVCRLALWRNLAPDTVSRIENLAGRFTTKLREVA